MVYDESFDDNVNYGEEENVKIVTSKNLKPIGYYNDGIKEKNL